jgi:hypothetical protein
MTLDSKWKYIRSWHVSVRSREGEMVNLVQRIKPGTCRMKVKVTASTYLHEFWDLNTCDPKVGCLHPVACIRSGSGFPSNVTLV